jgi:membrane-associated phospholipid phosphatase
VLLIAGEAILAKAVRFEGLSQMFDPWPGLALLLLVLGYCTYRSFPRLIEACVLAIWAVLLTNTLALLILIAGRSQRPLVDRALFMIDSQARFSTVSIMHLAARLPLLNRTLDLAYGLLPVLIVAAVLIPVLAGRSLEARRFIVGIVLAAIVTAAFSALWPAVGPWTTECIAPNQQQADVAAYIMRLRSSGPAQIDMVNSGIVSFPSFHVVLAIFSAVALSSIRWLRLWVWLLCVMICISAITTGWHYGVDVLGGAILAPASIIAAGRILRAYP